MILITSGCSFSECISPWIDTWPRHVERAIGPAQAFHEGLGSQGNGMISRQIIWRASQLLDQANELIVGIMWSAPERHELLLSSRQQPVIDFGMIVPGYDDKLFNPYNWIKDTDYNWLLLHHSSTTELAKRYYLDMDNRVFSQLATIEHILRVQWFLKANGIKYFMTTYTDEVLPVKFCQQSNIKYLYDQIDFDQFLPISGEYEWCRDHSGLEFPVPGDKHPSSEQHNLFTHQVIIPFLQQKGYI